MPAHRRAKLGIRRSFQQAASFPELTTRENIAIATGHSVRSKAEIIGELAARVTLQDALDEYGANLSWGQSRLLGIAMALAHQPDLVMLDEPFAGLSPVAVDQIVSVINEIRSPNLTFLLVDHNIAILKPLLDRLAVFHRGQLLADGEPDDVLSRPDVVGAYLGT